MSAPIAGICFDIDNEWWNGHGPGSGCLHCDPEAAAEKPAVPADPPSPLPSAAIEYARDYPEQCTFTNEDWLATVDAARAADAEDIAALERRNEALTNELIVARRAPDAGLRAKVEAMRTVAENASAASLAEGDYPRADRFAGGAAALGDVLAALATSPAPAGLDVERLARAIDDTPTFVNWRVDKGDRYEAVKAWAADIAAAYVRAATRPAEDADHD